MIFLSALPTISPVSMDMKVISVERKMVFAGRLGQRIEETLTLEKDGMTATVRLGRAHTRHGAVAEFAAGDIVHVRGVSAGKTVLVLRDAIRK